MNGVSRWRIAAASAVIAALLGLCAVFAPIYYHSYQFGGFISTIPSRIDLMTRSGDTPSEDTVLDWVLSEARGRGLPVKRQNVQLERLASDGPIGKIAVHYSVTVSLPGYSVDLHFNPHASL